MALEQENLDQMFAVTEPLASVRRPYPKQLDAQKAYGEVEKVMDFLDNDEAIAIAGGQRDNLVSLTMMIIMTQRVMFNRTLRQITPDSLVDGVLITLKVVAGSRQLLAIIAEVTLRLSDFLVENKLTPLRDLADDYLERLSERDPQLLMEMGQPLEGQEDGAPVSGNPLSNAPLELLDEEDTPFFVQSSGWGIDWNEFIAQVAAKNSPAQLQLAYYLFDGYQPLYQKILQQAGSVGEKKLTEQETDQVVFQFSLIWIFSKALNRGAIVDLAKVFHLFMKFNLDRGGITAQQYAITQRLGNQALIGVTLSRKLSEPVDFYEYQRTFNEGCRYADEVFTNPNYTVNVAKLQRLLLVHEVVPGRAFYDRHDYPLALKKQLDQHQLELEMAKANKLMAAFESGAVVADLSSNDWATYKQLILQVHHDMVVRYNRRLRQWTMESIRDCFQRLYQEQRVLDKKPAFFRVFQYYLYTAEDNGALKNTDGVLDGVAMSMPTYIAESVNAMTTY